MAKGFEPVPKEKPKYITKKKRLNMPLEKVYGQVADRSRKRLKERGNIKIEDLINKGKEDIEEAKSNGCLQKVEAESVNLPQKEKAELTARTRNG